MLASSFGGRRIRLGLLSNAAMNHLGESLLACSQRTTPLGAPSSLLLFFGIM